DIFLPDVLGWTVLARLKQDPATRHIPVQIVTIEEERQHGLERGAYAFLAKPATTEGIEEALQRIKRFAASDLRRLLIVEDDDVERMSIEELIRHDDVEVVSTGTGDAALKLLAEQRFDCIVLDLGLPDIGGLELLERIEREQPAPGTPIVVFTGRELSDEEDSRLRRVAKSVVIKGVQSPERLFDET